VADYFASIGFVGVNAGYRLAPDSKWPEGARDVGAVVTWLRDHAAEYGGNPNQIFVVGVSTGSLHAATYVFRPELLLPGTARPAGAVLVSGPYTFDFSAPTPGELAYFGEDKARWPEMVVTGNVTRADIPVLLTTAEWDDPRYLAPRHSCTRNSSRSTRLGLATGKVSATTMCRNCCRWGQSTPACRARSWISSTGSWDADSSRGKNRQAPSDHLRQLVKFAVEDEVAAEVAFPEDANAGQAC